MVNHYILFVHSVQWKLEKHLWNMGLQWINSLSDILSGDQTKIDNKQ